MKFLNKLIIRITCNGLNIGPLTLQVKYTGKRNISFFKNSEQLSRKMNSSYAFLLINAELSISRSPQKENPLANE